MPNDKLSQVRLNGVTYDIKDAEALRFGTGGSGNQNEIVVLSDTQGAVIASGTTLDDLYTRIDKATIVENVDDGEWIINIVNGDSTVDLTNYYSKGAVDNLVYNALRDYVTSATFASTLSAYYTKSEVDNVVAAALQVLDNYVTSAEFNSALDGIYSKNEVDAQIATALQALQNYVTTTTFNNTLSNYYTKDQVYNAAQVDAIVANIQKVTIVIRQVLPQSGSPNIIYFVPKTQSQNDVYDEYMWINNKWEHIGSTEVDLADYALKSEVPDSTSDLTNDSGFITSADVVETEIRDGNTSSSIYTGQEICDMWDAKKSLTYNRGRIVGIYKRTTDMVFLYEESNNDYSSPKVTIWSASIPLSGKEITYSSKSSLTIDSETANKLNNGSVVQNNSKFVTGGQVYTADEGVKTWVGQQGYLTSATLPASDTTLATSGAYADSKATGDKINTLNNIVLGKNLASNTTYTKDRAIQWSTGLSYASSLIHTAYVDLGDATEIIYPRLLSISEQSTAIFGMAFYTEQYTYISGQNSLTGYEAMDYAPTKIEVPANAKYARFSWSNVLPAFWVYDTDDVDYDVTAPEWKTAAIIGNKIDKPVAPTDGQVLTYDTTTGAWVADTLDLSSKISDPVTKSNGQVLTYDGTNHVWKAADASGGASIYISDSAPASPTNGMLWIDTDDTTYDIPDGDNGSY